jgi:hypothetical protein
VEGPTLNCNSCLRNGGRRKVLEAPGQAGTSGYSLLSEIQGFTRITPSWAQDTARTPSRRHSRPWTIPREPPVGEKDKNDFRCFSAARCASCKRSGTGHTERDHSKVLSALYKPVTDSHCWGAGEITPPVGTSVDSLNVLSHICALPQTDLREEL